MIKQIATRLKSKEAPIGVVGLGYVGLPLACLLAQKFKVVGFDINARRVDELKTGHDRTGEVEEKSKLLNPNLSYTTSGGDLSQCPLIIVAVPTPVDGFKVPDLHAVISASKSVGKALKKGTVVVYESTVYPGVTEDVCGKHLAEQSGLKAGVDFFLGYSPERVNPGDKLHTIDKIVKIVSGSTPEVTELLQEIYGSVVTAGIYKAQSIKTAEAAKVIENTQRDLNIALVNELSMLFDKLGLDTLDVLEAAGTKWNFLNFRPGLVGGHCIGVDPYYLTYLAEGIGFHPQVISAGRRINDNVGAFVAQKALNLILASTKTPITKIKVGILGVTFKENVPDIRNTKVTSVADSLESFGVQTFMVDPIADHEDFEEEYHRKLVPWDELPECDALILAVKHDVFMKDFPLEKLLKKAGPRRIILDLKGCLSREKAKELGVTLWRL